MTKLFYIIVIVSVLFFGLTFTYMNHQFVEIRYFSFAREISLAALLLITLLCGAVTGFIFSMLSSLKVRRNLSKVKKELKHRLPADLQL